MKTLKSSGCRRKYEKQDDSWQEAGFLIQKYFLNCLNSSFFVAPTLVHIMYQMKGAILNK